MVKHPLMDTLKVFSANAPEIESEAFNVMVVVEPTKLGSDELIEI